MEKLNQERRDSNTNGPLEAVESGAIQTPKSLTPPPFQLKTSPMQMQLGESEFPYEGQVQGATSIALRSSALKDPQSPHQNTIADIPKGEKVTVKGRSGGWLQVEWKGKEGFVSQELIAKKSSKSSETLGPLALGSSSGKLPQESALSVNYGGILAGAKHSAPSPLPLPATKVIETTSQAKEHYYNGGGASVDIGPDSIKLLLDSGDFQAKHERITTGKTTSLTGNFSVDMTWIVFHIGRTNVDYEVVCTGDQCTVTYKLFVNDGFWDPNFVSEKVLGGLGFDSYQPDGMGPNLEASGGSPYRYNTAIRAYTFKNPGY